MHGYLKYMFKSAFCKITSTQAPPPSKKKIFMPNITTEFDLNSINMYSLMKRESTVLSNPLRV